MLLDMERIPRSTVRYRKDEEYRREMIEKVRKRHRDNLMYPVYVKLCKVRNSISNYRISIEYHKGKVKMFQNRIHRAIISKERLEIEWGKVRAERKRRRYEQ